MEKLIRLLFAVVLSVVANLPTAHAVCELLFADPVALGDWPQTQGQPFEGHPGAHHNVENEFAPQSFLSTKEFAQKFKEKLVSLTGQKIPSPLFQISSILRSTNPHDLSEMKRLALKRQNERYVEAAEQLIKLRASPDPNDQKRANKIEAVLKKDPIGADNGPHLIEVMHYIDQASFNELMLIFDAQLTRAELDHLYLFQQTLVAVHDLGKTFPATPVLDAASLLEESFVAGRIGMHELSSATEILWIAKSNHFDKNTSDLLIRNILGHNDGSGLRNVWWNRIGRRNLGPDHLPDTLFSMILTLADRGAQSTLGPMGGVQKITLQQLISQPWDKNLLNQTMKKNAESTLRQMKKIAERFESTFGYDLKQSPLYQNLVQQPEHTIQVYKQIKWNRDHKSGSLEGQEFFDSDSFFKIIHGQASQSLDSAPTN